MIADAVEDNGSLKKQQKIMNIMIWIVCVMVLYNIFYNRFLKKERFYEFAQTGVSNMGFV